jgi:hypothetical protein
MSIPLPVNQAAYFFSQPITAYETTGTRVNGKEVRVVAADRTIYGVIQPADPKEIELYSDGALSSGSLILHTTYPVSAYDVGQSGQVTSQTYVRYKGETWKLWKIANWDDKTFGFNRYLMEKYKNIDDPLV